MTTPQRDGVPINAFSRWIRKEPRLDSIRYDLGVNDCDMWVHRYLPRKERRGELGIAVLDYLMLIEIKTFGAEPHFSQRDTLAVVNEVLRASCVSKNGQRRPLRVRDSRDGRPRAWRYVKCYGVHFLQMSADAPNSSDHLLWDHQEISLEMLIELLLFDRDPDHPLKYLDSRRHHALPRKERPIELPLTLVKR